MAESIHLEIETPIGCRSIMLTGENRASRLTDVLRREQFPVNTRCGQRGVCDGCLVEVRSGRLVHLRTGETADAGPVRACEYRVGDGNVKISIPSRSRLACEPQIVSEFRVNIPRAQDPLWQVVEVQPGSSVRETVAGCVDRRLPVRLAKDVPDLAAGKTFATVEYRGDHWLVTAARSDVPGRTLGVAVDVGTTTVTVLLVDLRDGDIVGSASGFNRQMDLADDVVSRIGLCAQDPAMSGRFREAILDQTILPLLAAANTAGDPVACFSIAGNTTMLHLLAGVDPSPMGVFPFKPAFLEHRIIAPTTTHLLPGAAAYIGADLVAGVLASGLAYDEGPSLLVDVGTNGEIILKTDDRLLGCATAAGPAFEGSRLTHGIRAGAGAIERIRFSEDPFGVHTEVIGNVVPIGVCGSAYVDFLAGARRIGLINGIGRLDAKRLVASANVSVPSGGRGLAVRVARTPGGDDILVSESDIASLLQAKAAIAAGILTLLAKSGLEAAEIRCVYLAGGFGMHLDVANAIACGLLPGFSAEQVQVVGNTSLAGAYLSLLDSGVVDELGRISRRLEVVELNLDPQFESRYMDQLTLPDPDRFGRDNGTKSRR